MPRQACNRDSDEKREMHAEYMRNYRKSNPDKAHFWYQQANKRRSHFKWQGVLRPGVVPSHLLKGIHVLRDGVTCNPSMRIKEPLGGRDDTKTQHNKFNIKISKYIYEKMTKMIEIDTDLINYSNFARVAIRRFLRNPVDIETKDKFGQFLETPGESVMCKFSIESSSLSQLRSRPFKVSDQIRSALLYFIDTNDKKLNAPTKLDEPIIRKNIYTIRLSSQWLKDDKSHELVFCSRAIRKYLEQEAQVDMILPAEDIYDMTYEYSCNDTLHDQLVSRLTPVAEQIQYALLMYANTKK
jgi:hypothetical protein